VRAPDPETDGDALVTLAELQGAHGAHVAERQRKAEAALAASGFDALLVSSGKPFTYFADDQDPPHRPTPHFAHWTPLAGPHHLLLVRPATKPRLVRFAPEDYWYEQAPLGSPFWADAFDLSEVGTKEAAWELAASPGRVAYVGNETDEAQAHGVAACNPPELVARLDWDRSFKTAYEVACIEEAERVAGRGHRAARAAFEAGGSELAIHHAYLAACGRTEEELPYTTIIGLDEKGATLHYTAKRTIPNGRNLLIDAGARHLGYASDITRTWTRPSAPARFRELVRGMDELQQELCRDVRPGLPYAELHAAAHARIGDVLHASGVLRVSGHEAAERGLTRPFFPHGLGHFLGLQVHDVAGHQREPAGGTNPPSPSHPYLRTTRTIEEGQVFTIEPGLYFIEMLLREHRGGADAAAFDWKLVDELAPCGGIRIEDNVVVTADGHRNLTRPHL
jgi:Xaa-Pro dipeptidase